MTESERLAVLAHLGAAVAVWRESKDGRDPIRPDSLKPTTMVWIGDVEVTLRIRGEVVGR